MHQADPIELTTTTQEIDLDVDLPPDVGGEETTLHVTTKYPPREEIRRAYRESIRTAIAGALRDSQRDPDAAAVMLIEQVRRLFVDFHTDNRAEQFVTVGSKRKGSSR